MPCTFSSMNLFTASMQNVQRSQHLDMASLPVNASIAYNFSWSRFSRRLIVKIVLILIFLTLFAWAFVDIKSIKYWMRHSIHSDYCLYVKQVVLMIIVDTFITNFLWKTCSTWPIVYNHFDWIQQKTFVWCHLFAIFYAYIRYIRCVRSLTCNKCSSPTKINIPAQTNHLSSMRTWIALNN